MAGLPCLSLRRSGIFSRAARLPCAPRIPLRVEAVLLEPPPYRRQFVTVHRILCALPERRYGPSQLLDLPDGIFPVYTHRVNDVYEFLARATGFEWDDGNATKVVGRHRVGPGECEQAVFREPFVVEFDETHSKVGMRWRAFGRTSADRRLHLVFTIHGTLIRVIAARDMSRKERNDYEQVKASVEKNSDL